MAAVSVLRVQSLLLPHHHQRQKLHAYHGKSRISCWSLLFSHIWLSTGFHPPGWGFSQGGDISRRLQSKTLKKWGGLIHHKNWEEQCLLFHLPQVLKMIRSLYGKWKLGIQGLWFILGSPKKVTTCTMTPLGAKLANLLRRYTKLCSRKLVPYELEFVLCIRYI